MVVNNLVSLVDMKSWHLVESLRESEVELVAATSKVLLVVEILAPRQPHRDYRQRC